MKLLRSLAALLCLMPAVAWAQGAKAPPGLAKNGDGSGLSVLGPGNNFRAQQNREADRAAPSIKEFGSETTCTGSGDDTGAFTAALSAAANKGGLFVYVSPGSACRVSSTIWTNTNNVVFGNHSAGATGHDVGANGAGSANWSMTWTGTAGGTIARVAPVAGSSNQALTGSGYLGASFICAGAGIGLQIQSVRNGEFRNLYAQECATAAYDVGAVSPLGEAADPQGNIFQNWNFRQINSSGVGVRLGGSITANTSMNTWINLRGQHKNGSAIQCINADNNTFIQSHLFRVSGGTGLGIEGTSDATGNCRDNKWVGLSAPGGVLFRAGEAITLGGTVTVGDVVSLTIASTALSTSPQTVSYTAASGNSLSTIATGLANAIGANSVLTTAGFSSTALGNALQVSWAGAAGQTATLTSGVTGSATETVALSPSDGGMVGVPATANLIIGPDVTNSDPDPVNAPGALNTFIRPNGRTNGLAVQNFIAGESTTSIAAAQALLKQYPSISGLIYTNSNSGLMLAESFSKCVLRMTTTGALGLQPIQSCPTFDLSLVNLQQKSATGISAAGTTLATATALTADLSDVTTVASGSGVKLAATIGQRQEVWNSGANALLVYPNTASVAIGAGSAGAAVSLAAGAHASFVCLSATLCRQGP